LRSLSSRALLRPRDEDAEVTVRRELLRFTAEMGNWIEKSLLYEKKGMEIAKERGIGVESICE
jgi:hypothetical protein